MNRSVTKRKNKNVAQKPRAVRKSAQKEKILELTLIKTYPRQVVWETWLPATPVKVTTTVTTGAIAVNLLCNTGAISNFATRFGNTFVEYRMIRIRMQIRFFSSTNPGVIQFWYDEKQTGSPTPNDASERAVLTCSAASVDRQPMLKWICSDTLDLQYSDIGALVTPVTFKAYSDNVNFGSSIVATDYFELEPEFQYQFRGLVGV